MPDRVDSSARTLMCMPARSASRTMSVATMRASTQSKTWTRIFCSVKWNIGENETTLGSFIWRKSASTTTGSGSRRRSSAMSSRLVGEQDPLAEQLVFEHPPRPCRRSEVEAKLGRLVAAAAWSRPPGTTQRGARSRRSRPRLALWTCGVWPRARRACDLGELAARLGEGLVEAPGLLVVQLRRSGVTTTRRSCAEDDLGRLEGREAREAPACRRLCSGAWARPRSSG